jgi:hypothetical protein
MLKIQGSQNRLAVEIGWADRLVLAQYNMYANGKST